MPVGVGAFQQSIGGGAGVNPGERRLVPIGAMGRMWKRRLGDGSGRDREAGRGRRRRWRGDKFACPQTAQPPRAKKPGIDVRIMPSRAPSAAHLAFGLAEQVAAESSAAMFGGDPEPDEACRGKLGGAEKHRTMGDLDVGDDLSPLPQQ